jgi:hypothetical protein
VAELVIEPGALFNGNSRIRESEATAGRKPPEPTGKKMASETGKETAKAG